MWMIRIRSVGHGLSQGIGCAIALRTLCRQFLLPLASLVDKDGHDTEDGEKNKQRASGNQNGGGAIDRGSRSWCWLRNGVWCWRKLVGCKDTGLMQVKPPLILQVERVEATRLS